MIISYPEAAMGPFIPRNMVGHRIGHELGSSDLGEQLVV